METNKQPEFVEFPAIQLKGFLLNEITRYKFPKAGDLAPNARAMRSRYAKAAGIRANAPAELFIASLKVQYEENKMGEEFARTLARFGLDTADFQTIK